MKIALAIIIILMIPGCSTSVLLNDRISYESEKAIHEKNISVKNIKIVGDQSNRKIIVSRAPNSMCGGAVTSKFNVGEVFNFYLEQISDSAGMGCDGSCKSVNVKMNSADIKYSVSCMQGKIEYGEFSSMITYTVNDSVGVVSESKKYSSRVTLEGDKMSTKKDYPITDLPPLNSTI